MSREGLLRLASGGLAAYPPSGLGELSTSCRELAFTLQDVRYVIVAAALEQIATWFSFRGDAAAMPNDAVDEVDQALCALPAIIEEPVLEYGTAAADRLRQDLGEILGRLG